MTPNASTVFELGRQTHICFRNRFRFVLHNPEARSMRYARKDFKNIQGMQRRGYPHKSVSSRMRKRTLHSPPKVGWVTKMFCKTLHEISRLSIRADNREGTRKARRDRCRNIDGHQVSKVRISLRCFLRFSLRRRSIN